MIALVSVALFFLLFLAHEFWNRGRYGVKPATFRDFLVYGTKTKAPSPKHSAFLFAALSCAFFTYWEGVIRWMISCGPHPALAALGILMMIVAIALRHQTFLGAEQVADQKSSRLPREIVWLLFLGATIGLGAWISLVLLFPWLCLRSLFLVRLVAERSTPL